MLNPNKVKYDTPELEPILKTTYGILVYQEQVMQTVRELAGFSKGQADTIRKSMGKKIQEILDEYKPYFINGSGDKVDTKTKQLLNIKGCTHNDIEEEVAKIIWDKMETFAKYAFNKSHAAGYGVMSVKTAWLSYYYPVIFMKANLNTYISNPKKVKPYIAYCTKMGINMLKPSVNKSDKMFSVEGDDIRFGLKGIKNVGTCSGLIIKERNIRGEFKSYQNFVERMNIHQKINKNAIESLIFAGALDEFEGTRKAKVEVLDKLVDRAKVDKKVEQSGQMTMFDLADSLGITSLKEIKEIKTPNLNEFEKDFMLLKEEECAGFFITEHPLDDYADILEQEGVIDIATLTEVDESESESESELFDIEDNNPYLGQTLKVAGVISDLEIKYSKKTGKPFVIFNLKDKTGDLKSVCFNKEKMKNEEKLIEGKKVIITGKFDCDDFGCQISVKNIQDLSSNKEVAKSISVIGSGNVNMARQQWKNLVDLAMNNEGCTKINFIKNGQIFEFPKTINLTWETLNRLQMMFGEKNCKLDAA